MNKPFRQNTAAMSAPVATVLAALIGVGGLVLGAFLTPLGQQMFGPNEQKVSLPQPATPQNTQASGSAALGDAQLCWGQIPILPKGREAHIRTFSFTFAKPFRSIPAVTTGINVAGTGYTFAVYNASVTETAYTGFLVEPGGRKTDVPVSMSYTAIGQPR